MVRKQSCTYMSSRKHQKLNPQSGKTGNQIPVWFKLVTGQGSFCR